MTGTPVDYIPRTRELYAPKPAYRWADLSQESIPWTPMTKPLAECRVALAASGGVHRHDQEPFHFKDDTSIRVVPTATRKDDLRVSHFGYPTGAAEKDPDCVFPVGPLLGLAEDGVIGGLAEDAVTFMGGIYSQRRVNEELIPAVLSEVQRLAVDLFYIVPA